jgi:hypothetical protein
MLITSNINKNDVIQGASELGQKSNIWRQAYSTGVQPGQNVNKPDELSL